MTMPPLVPSLPPPGNRWLVGLAAAAALDDATLRSLLAADPTTDDPYAVALEPLVNLLRQANEEYFRFELSGALGPTEPRRLTLAAGDTSFGHDLGLATGDTTRKLVALAVLGVEADAPGELRLPLVGKARPIVPGTVFVWPAFLDALVDLPPGGTVDALSLHAFGPSFR